MSVPFVFTIRWKILLVFALSSHFIGEWNSSLIVAKGVRNCENASKIFAQKHEMFGIGKLIQFFSRNSLNIFWLALRSMVRICLAAITRRLNFNPSARCASTAWLISPPTYLEHSSYEFIRKCFLTFHTSINIMILSTCCQPVMQCIHSNDVRCSAKWTVFMSSYWNK